MIIVTGANGFIGSALCAELSARYPDEELLAVDPIPLSEHDLLSNKSRVRLITSDQLWAELEAVGPNVRWVIHMGACSSTTEQNWDYLQANNVDYTERLFAWCAAHAVPLIYASSAAVYGDGALGFRDDINTEQLVPLNLYGKSKVLVDQWVLKQAKTPPQWYGLRFFNVFGPNEYFKGPMSSLAFKAYFQILETKKLKLFKSHHKDYRDGEQLRDFVYVKDITRWMVELMETKPESGIYNMGYGTARSWLDVAKPLFAALHLPMEIEFIDIPENIRNQYQYFTEADMSRSFARGLSKPQWALEEGIGDYVTNYLAPGNKIY